MGFMAVDTIVSLATSGLVRTKHAKDIVIGLPCMIGRYKDRQRPNFNSDVRRERKILPNAKI